MITKEFRRYLTTRITFAEKLTDVELSLGLPRETKKKKNKRKKRKHVHRKSEKMSKSA